MKTCALCKKNNELKDSHLIPKFVSNWIKSTSATGKLRPAIAPNHRVQDTIKVKLLCNDCECLFSKFETYFADSVFYPVIDSDSYVINYNKSLLKFAVSLSWRILVYHLLNHKTNIKHIKELKEAEKNWREYLLSNVMKNDYEHHMLMLRYIWNAPKISGTDVDINWYYYRTVDGTIIQNNEESIVFVKLPGFAFFSSVIPKNFKHGNNTIINNIGALNAKKQSLSETVRKYLIQRSIEALAPISNISKKQLNKIDVDCYNNLEKVGNSYGFQLFLRRELSNSKETE